MKTFKGISVGLLILSLGSCDGHDHTAQDTTRVVDATSTEPDSVADHSGHGTSGAAETMPEENSTAERLGHATGTIRSVNAEDGFLMVQHGPFSGGIDMGAMTMGFDIMGDVDLAGFEDGDNIAFMVKQGFDDGLRIMQICNTDTSGEDCLQDSMQH